MALEARHNGLTAVVTDSIRDDLTAQRYVIQMAYSRRIGVGFAAFADLERPDVPIAVALAQILAIYEPNVARYALFSLVLSELGSTICLPHLVTRPGGIVSLYKYEVSTRHTAYLCVRLA
jgi:hypothetical protein